MILNHSTVRRLAFVKYLFKTSTSQSRAPWPVCCASLLTMHDAVELFLQLATEHLNAGSQRPDFMDYWSLLRPKLARDLEQAESMRRLNKARVALKHHGTFPSQLDIEAFRGSTESFFRDNTPLVFGVSLDDVTLVEFVNPESARQKLKEAEAEIAQSNTLDASDKIAIAFEEMIDNYEHDKRERSHASPFYFGRDLNFLNSFFMDLRRSEMGSPAGRLGEFVDRVKESIEAMQQAIKILALGLDYRKYSRFQHLMPLVYRAYPRYGIARKHTENSKITQDEARFCIDFVVESALALAEFDYRVVEA